MDSQLRFAEHTAAIIQTGHQQANLIHRCFTPKKHSLFIKAYFLEYNGPTTKEKISRS